MQLNYKISIPSFQISEEDGRTTHYQIKVQNQNKEWVVQKRYSDFKKLKDSLTQYFGEILPDLPKKKYITFLVGKSDQELDQRRLELEKFLHVISQNERIINSGQFQSFLSLNQSKVQVTILQNFKFGIRDFYYSEDLLIILNAETNALSRFDAYIQNIIDDEATVPVGSIECWEHSVKSWTKKYNSQAICLYFHNQSLLVGLDNGMINYLTILPGKINTSYEIEQHQSRVMGVHLFNQLIYSVSKDQNYRVVNFQTGQLEVDYHHNYELTCLKFNEIRNCAFIGDRNGQIMIFQNSSKLVTLDFNDQFLRDLTVDPIKNYLIGICFYTGSTIVYDIGGLGQEKNTKKITQFKNKDKSRCVCWSSSRGEVFIGNSDGTITIWSAKDCSPIKEYQVHQDEITKMIWNEDASILMTSSKDKTIKIICLPKRWDGEIIIEKQKKSLDDIEQWDQNN
ncbi:unnamed protein product [Paramecium octaurelia]|uniref:PX domain-containing protein n=1 Tax=Paramecium octaurelia TaxID=43137 RepID=A0A8S1S8C6_PAROT|nr:unnamed protein product [Paramecium octaurelia]